MALSLVAHVVLEVVDRGGLSDSGESERARLLHLLNDQREGAWSRLVVSLVAAVVSQYRADRGIRSWPFAGVMSHSQREMVIC